MFFQPRSMEASAHQAAAHRNELLVERQRIGMRHLFDRAVARVRVDRRAREHEARDLVREARRVHRRHPAALTQPDQVHAPAQLVDTHVQFGKVLVDLEILHVLGRRTPVGQVEPRDAVLAQRLHQALPRLVIGDHRAVAGIRRIDDRRQPLRLRRRVVAKDHRAQLEQRPVLRGERRTLAEVQLLLLRDESQIAGSEFGAGFEQRGGGRHRPEDRQRRRRGSVSGFHRDSEALEVEGENTAPSSTRRV
jgi:hypothetical protein